MTLRGPAPQENRRRTNKDTFGAEKVLLTENEIAELRKIPDGDWFPEVRLWWRVWSGCAQSALFSATDWLRLRILMVTVQSYYQRPTAQKMAEIRQTEGLLGATYVDRMKARIKVEKPSAEKSEARADLRVIDSYRKKLIG